MAIDMEMWDAMSEDEKRQAMLDVQKRMENVETQLQVHRDRRLTYKVSEKGACSVYGLGKWPVTLYPEQWAKVFAEKEAIENFIKENQSKFTTKDKKNGHTAATEG